eukprot:TRINITY_DN12250_c0_g3_i2.p1 TRINITY_DN12250_c0_g3~~TRINITY_DN12250_c0_g3_i2.p1  ORF type:complete len:392 (+),score=105.01 TRINITY_DN12250_c0_g3_i2:60-1235(+)
MVAAAKRVAPPQAESKVDSKARRCKVARRSSDVSETRAEDTSPSGKAEPVTTQPFQEECSPIFELLDRATDLSDATRRMLRAAAPHGLRTPVESRHGFQEQLNDVLASVFRSVASRERDAVVKAEAAAADATRELAAIAAERAVLEMSVAAKNEARSSLEAKMSEATSVVGARKSAVLEAEKLASSAEGSVVSEQRLAHEKMLAEQWEPLKAGLPSKQWRDRNKMILVVVGVLEKLEVEASLLRALPFALKAKLEERGDFVAKSIQFGDEAFGKHLSSLNEKLESVDAEAAARSRAIDVAKAAVKEAEKAQDERQNEFVVCDNEVAEANADLQAIIKKAEGLTRSNRGLFLAVEEAQANLASVEGLIAQFEALRKSGIPETCGKKDASSTA